MNPTSSTTPAAGTTSASCSGEKVEAKVRRKIRAWAEAEPDEDWEVVGKKAEAKLKSKLREWADEP